MRDGIRIISAAANSGSEEGGLRLRALEAAPGAEAVAQETQFGKASGTGGKWKMDANFESRQQIRHRELERRRRQ